MSDDNTNHSGQTAGTAQKSEEEILRDFNLTAKSQPVECEFYAMAQKFAGMLPRSSKRTAALQKLLEAKNAAT